jgi:hypothetical protein
MTGPTRLACVVPFCRRATKPIADTIDGDALAAAFCAHKEGHTKFTRRMAINIADHFGSTPRQIVTQLERAGLLKRGAWKWFVSNGGFSKDNYTEARADRAAERTATIVRQTIERAAGIA